MADRSSLFAGVLPAAVQSAIEKALYFYVYTSLETAHLARIGPMRSLSNLAVGYVSDAAHLPLTLPIDRVVKVDSAIDVMQVASYAYK